jgi:hypothetical protein
MALFAAAIFTSKSFDARSELSPSSNPARSIRRREDLVGAQLVPTRD